MTTDEFLAKPTERNHRAYADSVFTPAAPEYATSEILLGSAYRKLLLGKPENEVDLELIPSVVSSIPADRGDAHTWRSILLELGGIASPARSGQRRSRPLPQLMPIIPEAARHGCVLGRKGKNRWTPANLLLDVLGAGIGELEGNELLNRLGEALAVGSADDFLARFLEDSLRHAAGSEQASPPKYEEAQLEDAHCRAYRARSVGVSSGNPAEQFCEDLKALLALKCELTRRQWTVLIEAQFRLGFGTHVLWTCSLNSRVWEYLKRVLDGDPTPTVEELKADLWGAQADAMVIEVGRDSIPAIKFQIEQYLHGRIGINLVLHRLEEVGVPWTDSTIGFSSSKCETALESIHRFIDFTGKHRHDIDANPRSWCVKKCAEVVDARSGLASCESGFTKNILEFVRHTLGQIETEDPERRAYDQSYLLANKTRRSTRRTRWLVELGPAMLIAVAHCCCRSKAPLEASLEDLREHLAKYRIEVPSDELSAGTLGVSLERLGLVVDSPDAAGGRLIVSPFRRSQ